MIGAARVKRRQYRSSDFVEACRPDGWHWIVPTIGPTYRLSRCGGARRCPFQGMPKPVCTRITL